MDPVTIHDQCRRNARILWAVIAALAFIIGLLITGCSGIQQADSVCIDILTEIVSQEGAPMKYAHTGCVRLE